METYDFRTSAQPKSLDRSRWIFARLIKSDVPKMIGISWMWVVPTWLKNNIKITSKTFLTIHFTLPCLALPYILFLVRLCIPDGSTDLHAHWLKWCGLLKRSAFFWSRWYEITIEFWNPNAKFPAKSMHSNNVWTSRDRRKISTDSLYKLGVAESSRRLHLAAKNTSSLILNMS